MTDELHEPKTKKRYIPYSTIYLPLDDFRKNVSYWIPNVPLQASIIKAEHDTSSQHHMWNPLIYTVEIEHGRYKWCVVKAYNDFSYLLSRLSINKAVEAIKEPVRRIRRGASDETKLNENDIDVSLSSSYTNKTVDALQKSYPEIEDYNATSGDAHTHIVDEFTTTIQDKIEANKPHENTPEASFPLPLVPDSMIQDENIENRRKRLEDWLRSVLNEPVNKDYHEMAEFFEVSRYSFINELGGKYKEGPVKKRPGGNRVFMGCKRFCAQLCFCWGRKWLVLKDSYMLYLDRSSERVDQVLLFDEEFGVNEIPSAINPREFVLSNQQYILNLRCKDERESKKWVESINRVLQTTGEVWIKPKRFTSSYPPRMNSHCEWFVDAKDCWQKLSSLLEMARDEVFITDWWLSPEIFLRRPMAEANYWRFDYVLKRCAERGVKIFILIYKEMEMAIGLNSLYTKRYLQKLHPNIKVMRHPDHFIGGTFFWAHHEKLLIIDQIIAFVGGLDLCYGRWDDYRHLLTDLGSVQIQPQSIETQIFKSEPDDTLEKADMTEKPEQIQMRRLTEKIVDSGHEIGEIVTTSLEPLPSTSKARVDETPTSRNFRARIHDALVKTKKDQKVANESNELEASQVVKKGDKSAICFTNIELNDTVKTGTHKSGIEKSVAMMSEPRSRTLMRRAISSLNSSKAKNRWHLLMKPEADQTDQYLINYCKFRETTVELSGLQGAGKLWPGKDYVNSIFKDFINVHDAFSDFINRYETPRMPWHDIHALVYGAAARDLARHFIQRWNATKSEKFKLLNNYPYLLPKSYVFVPVPQIFIDENTHKVEVQVLRSASHWSALIDRKEDSIQQAYISLIEDAEHYIYIENQFFISMVGGFEVGNRICQALFDRVTKAHKNGETFRIFILIPLLPGFEGDIGVKDSATLLAVVNWTIQSISKGDNSLIQSLKRAGIENIRDYLCFCSLRTHGELCGKLVTELIYIHSKLMIVDDKKVIIGSANINDRSQLGDRDSEVCILITDHELIQSEMDEQPYMVGRFASSLRKRLMREHLGLLDLQHCSEHPVANASIDDPVASQFYHDIWFKTADTNAEIFEDVFHCYPNNKVQTLEELKNWRREVPLVQTQQDHARQKLKELVGSLVTFPINFLRHANLSPSIYTKEGLVPNIVFT